MRARPVFSEPDPAGTGLVGPQDDGYWSVCVFARLL